jgi:rhamnogalacturonyl hydrolase YesR
MKNTLKILLISLIWLSHGLAGERTPLAVVRSVADKVIRESVFEFQLTPQTPVLGVQVVDFRRTLGSGPGVAYALSYVVSKSDTMVTFGVSSSDAIKIWINDEAVFRHAGSRPLVIAEIAYGMVAFQDTFSARLKSGSNKILMKAATHRPEFVALLRELGDSVEYTVDSVIKEAASNWLCIGPFPISENADWGLEILDAGLPPELEFKPLYSYDDRTFLWTLPRHNALLELEINPENSYIRDSYLDWHYANGAMMWSLLALADATNDKTYADFVRRYCDFVIEHSDYFRWQYDSLYAFRGSYHRIFRRSMLDDAGAPTLPFIELQVREPSSEYRPLVDNMLDYVSNQQVRLSDGTFCRPEPEPMTVWADDLFMSVPLFLRAAKLTSDSKYNDDAARQILNFNKLLFNSKPGLYYHGWFEVEKKPSVAFWGRANGWVIWATSEALTHLPKTHRDYQKILELFQRHAAGLIGLQSKSGLWHQVLDHPESYEETSCTAMFALAMARGVRNGWLDQKYREAALKGWDGVKSKIDDDGTVHGICRGTEIGGDLEFYFKRQTFDHDPRGLGAVITAGVEISKLLANEQ